MVRVSFAFALAAVLTAAPALAADTESHSGTLARIDTTKHVLTLQEMGPWHGAGTRPTERSIVLTPDTRVELLQRSKQPAQGGWPGGWIEQPLDPAQLHPGDFATVKAKRTGGRLTAVTVDVVRPPES